MRIYAVVTIGVLVAAIFAMSNLSQPAMARNNDKCTTFQSKDKERTTSISCTTGTHDEEAKQKEIKEICKALDNKEVRCSSSQTGNGGFDGNFDKNK